LKSTFTGLLRFAGIALSFCSVIGVVLLLFVWYGSYSDKLDRKVAAYDAVIDYANNRSSLGFNLRDTDKIIAKPSESESCPGASRVWGIGFRSYPCWIVEYPTAGKTYRWFVDENVKPACPASIPCAGKGFVHVWVQDLCTINVIINLDITLHRISALDNPSRPV
jgi:hypothetical protein